MRFTPHFRDPGSCRLISVLPDQRCPAADIMGGRQAYSTACSALRLSQKKLVGGVSELVIEVAASRRTRAGRRPSCRVTRTGIGGKMGSCRLLRSQSTRSRSSERRGLHKIVYRLLNAAIVLREAGPGGF